MRSFRRLACLLPLLAGAAHAQDERRVVSPDGQLEFRLFTAVPEGSGSQFVSAYRGAWLSRQAATRYFLPRPEHPFPGTTAWGEHRTKRRQEAVRRTLQRAGGRLSAIKYDRAEDSVRSAGLERWRSLQIHCSDVAAIAVISPHGGRSHAVPLRPGFYGRPTIKCRSAICRTRSGRAVGRHLLGAGQQASRACGLIRSDPRLMLSHLPDKPHDPHVTFEGKTPWTSPWRMIVIGRDREQLAESEVVRELGGR